KKVDFYICGKTNTPYRGFYNELQNKLTACSEEVKNIEDLLFAINLIFIMEESQGNKNIRSHTSTLVTRIEEIKSQYENNLFSGDENKQNKLKEVLNLNYIDSFLRYDVSKLTNEDLLFFTSYILERLYKNQIEQRDYDNKRLVHCIFDEAHQYIRDHFKEERLQTLHMFEKVAREGRKFGLFMIVISQRPSELSHTVLSQCNNYILHRIRNSVDLEFMRKSIPYLTSHQLSRLSYMKSGTAILVGEAFSIPMELKIKADDDIKNQSSTFSPSNIWLFDAEKE